MPITRTLPIPRWLILSLTMVFSLALLAPIADVAASTNLTSGDETTITYANGDTVRLRSKAGPSGAIVGEFSEGTPVRIIDGPIQASDGTFWYRVAVEGESGYMAAEFLADPNAQPAEPTPNPVDEPADDPTPQPTPGSETGSSTSTALAKITGSATIANTNGDPIRCRGKANPDGSILAELFEGATVQLTGEVQGEWQPIICDEKNGWVHAEFITIVSQPTPTAAPTVEVSSLTGRGSIKGTNGDGARCRKKASTNGEIITVLAEGAAVTLRGSISGDWLPVVCDGSKGYVWSKFVSTSSSGGNGGTTDYGTASIVNTNGLGIRCRNKGSLNSDLIKVMVEGDEVKLRGTVRNNWQPVWCDDKKGYIFADFIGDTSGGNSGGNSGSGLQSGDAAEVTGTGGMGVRLRSTASTSGNVITVASEGSKVKVRAGSTGAWIAVTFQNLDGFIHGDYLSPSTGVDPEPGDGGSLSDGAHALVTSTLNFRSEGNSTAGIVGVATEGTVVLITGNKSRSYFPVEWGGMAGFMHSDYLEWTDADLTPGSSGVGGDAGSGSGNADGQAMINYAMKYLGYPYIWATAGPNSFDCSGFTYWVTLHILGDDIGRGTWSQSVAGTPVSYGNLMPGDLVFFQNTYTWGLSHVGIYIGDNQFIHAENEETGVRISSITSTYYSTRWFGAVRLT